MCVIIPFPIPLEQGIYSLDISKSFVYIWNDYQIINLFISLLLLHLEVLLTSRNQVWYGV